MNVAALQLSELDRAELTALEEAFWRAETRFDPAFLQRHLAADFTEFGRSGAAYTRDEVVAAPAGPIDCQLPLPQLTLRAIDAATVLLTHDSVLTRASGQPEHAHRASLWTRGPQGWQMRFHQGTPFVP